MTTSAQAESEDKQRDALASFRFFAFRFSLLLALVFAAYWPALRGQFVWDDQLLVLKNPLVTGQASLRTVWLQTDFSLTTVALWWQWLMWGNNPAGYHVVNVSLHALSCVVLWRVLLRLKIPGAWLAAAIFAVHPVAAASVAWISEMKNTLSLVFCLFSFLFYLKFEERRAVAEKTKARLFYFLSLGAFLLALLSKTSTVMLPVVWLMFAWWRGASSGAPISEPARYPTPLEPSRFGDRRSAAWPAMRGQCLRLTPFFLLALLLGCATIWFQARVMATGDPVQAENMLGRLAAAGRALWFYLGKVILPVNLSMIYPRWKIDQAALGSYVPVILWLGVLALVWKFRRRPWGRAAFLALACFTVSLFPVLGFLSMDYLVISRVSDHFQYLPMIAIIVLFAAGLNRLPATLLTAIATISVLLLAFGTFQRSETIAHDETLWRDTLEKNPESFTAHNNWGCILAGKNNLDAAIREFRATLRLRPQNAPAHGNLGRAFAMRHDFAQANDHFEAALKTKPTDADIQQSYATALAEQGKLTEAIRHLREAIRLEPRIELRLHLAALLRGTGNFSDAVAQYREVLQREPDSVEALNNAAWLLATSPDGAIRNGAEAVRLAEEACRLTENKKAGMVGTLAAAYAEAGRFVEAVAAATKAANLADAAGDTQFAAVNRQLLSLYRAGRPYREPAAQ